jgi:hypothetical protein
MEMKFDPKAKVKQGDLSTTPEGKQPNQEPGNLKLLMVERNMLLKLKMENMATMNLKNSKAN